MEKRKPLIAVLMATYNGEKYLRQQLDSILAQSGVDVRVFIRDDHSSDNTLSLVGEYLEGGNVFLLPAKTGQLGVTKNFYSIVKEIDLSAFDGMCYSDQDDIWLENKLNRALTQMEEHHVDCYASNLLRADANGNIIQERSLMKRLVSYLFNNKSGKQTAFDHYLEAASAGCTLVLKKNVALYFQQRIVDIYDRLPVDTSHDWSTYAITRLGGFKWTIDNRSYIIYRQHAENAYGANLGLGGVKKLLEWFTSGRYRMHILMIDELYNTTGEHPAFMDAVKKYNPRSVISRFRMAVAVSGYRRKRLHRIFLFLLIIFGYCK